MEAVDPKWIRVSSILAMIPTRDSQGEWGYPLQKIDKEILQKKADIGTEVHAAIACHNRGQFYVLTDTTTGYVDSYISWAETMGIEAAHTEKRLYHEEMKLTGCIDMLAKRKGRNSLLLYDFKCTSAADPLKWKIQAALYHLLCQKNGMDVEKTAFFVQLDPKGELPTVHRYEITKEVMGAAIGFYNSYVYLTGK